MMHHYYLSHGGNSGEQGEQQHLASEEHDWAWKARTGDHNAFTSLVHLYQGALFDYIYHVLQDSEWAADILQNVFLRFYLSLSQLELEKTIKPWLFQVAHNCCMDALREQIRYRWKPFFRP